MSFTHSAVCGTSPPLPLVLTPGHCLRYRCPHYDRTVSHYGLILLAEIVMVEASGIVVAR